MTARRGRAWAGIAAIAALALAPPAVAEDALPQTVALHAQATLVAQSVDDFRSPYAGANSLKPADVRETADLTLYAGIRPWAGAELWANPEMDQGFGLSNTLGAAGFPSGEAYKVGKASPYVRLQRLFLRQSVALGGARAAVAADANQLAGRAAADRLVLTVGKFGVVDVFDTNRYAHDPRADFFNWSVIDAGAFDYAADAWGYSLGAAAELYHGDWTLRLGVFALSREPNGETLSRDFGQNQLDGEIEHRHTLAGHPGAVRLTVFRSFGRFARFGDVLAAAAPGAVPDPARFRRPMSRWGGALGAEQELSATVGMFARLSLADGAIEAYDFTDIDRSASAGLQLAGAGWHRGDDRVGLAVAIDRIGAARRAFLAAGGLSILVGDGRLPHPGDERIVEAFYRFAARKGLAITADYQHVVDPGYNRDRGPANVLALRLHGAF